MATDTPVAGTRSRCCAELRVGGAAGWVDGLIDAWQRFMRPSTKTLLSQATGAERRAAGSRFQVARGRPVSLDMSSQEGIKAQGAHVRQTLRRLDPALTVLVHMPPAPDVNVRRGGGNNGAPHAFLTSPSISQSCAPLTFAARRAHRCFVFLLSGAGAEGGGDFQAREGVLEHSSNRT